MFEDADRDRALGVNARAIVEATGPAPTLYVACYGPGRWTAISGGSLARGRSLDEVVANLRSVVEDARR